MQSIYLTNGTLFLVATPIGNLKDISLRAIEILKEVDLILAEDTRHSRILLNNYLIETKAQSLHKFNEQAKSQYCLDLLLSGQNIAVISDAGTPLISDPGYDLVRLCHENHIKVSSIPGACAAISALTVSGLPCSSFTFHGFLPNKSGQKVNFLSNIKNSETPQIFYESPKRILKTFENILEVYGAKKVISVSKEITKQFEETFTGNVSDAVNYFNEHPDKLQGEFVLIISGHPKNEQDDLSKNNSLDEILTTLFENDISLKQAVKISINLTGLSKNVVYKRALELQN